MIITLCRHEDGRPVAMIPATGKKEDCEVSEARALLADPQVRLENAIVTADPHHHKQATVRVTAEKGGDYLVGTKDNTPNSAKVPFTIYSMRQAIEEKFILDVLENLIDSNFRFYKKVQDDQEISKELFDRLFERFYRGNGK